MNSNVTQPLQNANFMMQHIISSSWIFICWMMVLHTSKNEEGFLGDWTSTEIRLVLCALIFCMKKSGILIAHSFRWLCVCFFFRSFVTTSSFSCKCGKKEPASNRKLRNFIVRNVIWIIDEPNTIIFGIWFRFSAFSHYYHSSRFKY